MSEWLLLQAFLLSPDLPLPYLNMLVPIAAAALVLAAALAGYVMVKFYGVIFLGQPRVEKTAKTHDIGAWELLGMGWLALGCLLLGLFPVFVIFNLDHVTLMLVGKTLGGTAAQTGWLLLTPIQPERASYSPLVLLVIIVTGVLFTLFVVKKFYHGRLRRGPAWDCGFPAQTARMQDTAEGFGQPIRQIFEQVLGVIREVPSPCDKKPHYRGETRDLFWDLIYLPIAWVAERISALIGKLQQGRIPIYLLYSFVTLIALLAFVR